jgi:indoleamine 2,3-dioxygenase
MPEPAMGRGFLPPTDPARVLPATFSVWEEVAADLPKLLVARKTRTFVQRLPVLDPSALVDGPELRRAMLLLSFMGHAFVWEGPQASPFIPASIAVPWHAVATRLGRPPILSYASYALDNWRRLEPAGPIALGNIGLLQNFLGGADEEWFITVHIDIEARAEVAMRAVLPAQAAVASGNLPEVERRLSEILRALEGMYETLARMPEWCEPSTYYMRVRPYIFGWKNQPALPNGLIYEGVGAYNNAPQLFRGETGAQSTIVPVIDALLGIAHHPDPLREYLLEMRDYMPPEHRAFLEQAEAGPSLRALCQAERGRVLELYDDCVELLRRFRALHLEYAATYIRNQAPRGPENPVDVGTGGTPFMRYLKKHEDETAAHRVK